MLVLPRLGREKSCAVEPRFIVFFVITAVVVIAETVLLPVRGHRNRGPLPALAALGTEKLPLHGIPRFGPRDVDRLRKRAGR